MLNKKLVLRISLNTLLGLILVIVWLQFVDLKETMHTLSTVNPLIIFAFLFLFLLSSIFRGLRLRLLLNEYKIPSKNLISLTFLSQLLSFFIPIRAGEITKSVYLSTQYNLPFAKAVTWVFIDRFLDLFGVLLLFGVLIYVVPNNLGVNAGAFVWLIILGLLSVAVLSVYSQAKSKRVMTFFSKLLIFKKVQQIFLSVSFSVIEGFLVLKKEKHELSGLIALTILGLISDSLIWFATFLSLKENIGVLKAVLGTQISALTFLIPAAPGYVGSLEASALAVWSLLLNIPNNVTSAGAVLFHILTVITLLIFGVSSIYFLKFDLSLVWKKIKNRE